MTALAPLPSARPAPAGPAAAPTGSGLPADLGRFSWDVGAGRASWSDSVYALHGYPAGHAEATVALALGHKHPEDLYGCVDALHAGMQTRRLIVHEHRVVDTRRRSRPAVMVARPVGDPGQPATQLWGLLLPTDTIPDGTATGQATTAPLVPVLMNAFGLSRPAARVLLAARRPQTLRRSPQEAIAQRRVAAAEGHDLRRMLEDSMFPLEHLSRPAVGLAA